jgi:Dynamin central region
VQNRGPRAPADFNREQEEIATFSKDPWLEIPPDQRGTPDLKKYLANLLCRRIREAFPAMQDTAGRLLQVERSKRQKFGKERIDHGQRLAYLMDIVKNFQDLSAKALSSPGDLPLDDLKLRGLTETEKERFAMDMMQNGHRYKFLEAEQAVVSEYDSDEDDNSLRMSVVSIHTPFSSIMVLSTNNSSL